MSQSPDDQHSDDTEDNKEGPLETEGASSSEKKEAKDLSQPSVKKKLKTFTLGRWHKGLNKESSKKRKSVWGFKLGRRLWRNSCRDDTEHSGSATCVCTAYQKTEQQLDENTSQPKNSNCKQQLPLRGSPWCMSLRDASRKRRNSTTSVMELGDLKPDYFSGDDWDERARLERAIEIEEGVDPPPGYQPSRSPLNINEIQLSELTLALRNHLRISAPYPYLERLGETIGLPPDLFSKLCERRTEGSHTSVHTQVDYVHCLVPDLLEISSCSFYWGKMDRYEAEKLLEKKTEGTFLLRDSAQEEYLFSVSFRRYGRSLHARIEQWNHKFSFDSHDPGVFASSTVCGLIEHYKDPSCCMFFEPMLTIPFHRTFPFSLQHLCRAVICGHITYDSISKLQLPKSLKSYLKEYHYKQRVRVRHFEIDH